ncbi:MAG: hypothetical protein ACRDRH_22655 [Pseudonocardia sp.]
MDLDDIFEGDVVVGVPTVAAEYGRKMPGHQETLVDQADSAGFDDVTLDPGSGLTFCAVRRQ